tara:strand:+ start:126 stop:419 length:294 start_codon:yes stop_codon:yes gene_type:complete
MMNDMMPTIEEAATPDILAQIEHEEWERGNEERERWEAVEVLHGPLMTAVEWAQHQDAMNDHIDSFHARWCDKQDELEEQAAEEAETLEWFKNGPCK